MSLKEKIERYFDQSPQLRVLFFFDEQLEHREEVEQLTLAGIEKLYWNNNNFGLKTRLHGDLKSQKVLLYLPMAAPRNMENYHAFPLLGLLVANKELALDDVGTFLDEFHLLPQHKNLVSKYMRELQYTTVKDVCRPILTATQLEEKKLIQGLLSAFLRCSNIESWSILLGKMLTLALPAQEEELNRFQKKVEENQLLELLQNKIHDYFGTRVEDISRDSLLHLLRCTLYNLVTQTLPLKKGDPYQSLKMDHSALAYFNQFLQETERNKKLRERLDEAIALVKSDIQSQKLIDLYGPDAAFAWYQEDMVWELIGMEIPNLQDNPGGSISRLENLTMQDDLLPAVQETLKFLIQSAMAFEKIRSVKRYILDTPDHYIQTYADEWMQIDTAYRKAVRIYRHGDLADAKSQLDLDQIIQTLNTAYEQHIDTMNREWLKCLSQYNFDYQNIRASKQYDFYKREVEPYDQKVVVIISDGLRYEAAADLLASLHGDPNNTADIRHQLASIPSKTNVGMAQLLPSTELTFTEGSIAADGIKTEGIVNRRQILARKNPEAVAEQFSEIQGKTQTELREIFKNKVVYVYHDVIDATGDKSASEHRTFSAVEETIQELALFIKKVHGSYNVAKVLITADHGFLYNDRRIEDKDKENSPNGKVIQNHSRFEISSDSKPVEMGYKFPLSATTRFSGDLFVTIPQSVNRYKLQGAGNQYVHGGGSLQELVVPVIESSRKRQEVTKKVTPMLLSRGQLRAVSNILRVQILQEDKVSRFEKELTITVGLYKDLDLVSNEHTLILNSTEEAPSERTHRVELNLLPSAAKESLFKLKVFDVDDKLNALIEELVQNNTLIQTDF